MKCQHCLGDLSQLRGHIIRAASVGGHADLLKLIFRRVDRPEDREKKPDGAAGEHAAIHGLANRDKTRFPSTRPSPLWIACERGNVALLERFIKKHGLLQGGKAIGKMAPKSASKMPLEKDSCINFQFWADFYYCSSLPKSIGQKTA